MLRKGERIHSALFPPDDSDRLVYVYGCPYCYEKKQSPQYNRGKLDVKKIKKRECPVCYSKLKKYDYLIGRMWDTEIKTHLKIIGCMKCRKSFKN